MTGYVEAIFQDIKPLQRFYSVDFTGLPYLKMLSNIANLVFHVKNWEEFQKET